MTTKYTIDASGRTIGRIASEAAFIIMGKNTAQFAKNIAPKVSVSIVNAAKTKITDKKKEEKEYYHFTGHPSGRKSNTLGMVLDKKGHEEVFRNAVYGMLPKNKLRKEMLKNLIVTE
ncbi:MAG: 50S ribosomal protein L13 [bacterium]|nr:50S ribosomal protein L13 [bacterium]